MVTELRRREGRNLIAASVFGSVAYGMERRHSDVDLLVLLRRQRALREVRVREGILITLSQRTLEEARREVTGASPSLPEILSGWRSMHPLHDPRGVLRRLIARAHRVPASQFRRAARAGFLSTYEDLGKLRDAVEARAAEKMREMAIWFTGGAASILLCLKRHPVPTGQELFVEVRRIGPTGRAIARLRYGNLSIAETSRLTGSIWSALRREANRQGIRLGDIP